LKYCYDAQRLGFGSRILGNNLLVGKGVHGANVNSALDIFVLVNPGSLVRKGSLSIPVEEDTSTTSMPPSFEAVGTGAKATG